ncbi:hypothetical protein N7540_010583 [Penicillium herquei]|nr:hypothetical protein N7540_010583 [Penicillium herquei]
MVNFFKRMRKLNTILEVRTGVGAALFPNAATATKEFPTVTRLHLTYARKIYNGHQGARHFWRRALPRLKYHNPSVAMTVKPTDEQEGPAVLTVYYSERLSSTAPGIAGSKPVVDKYAPAPDANEKSAVIDLKNLTFEEIWRRVQASTGAKDFVPTADDEANAKNLADIAARAPGDRQRIKSIRQAKKDQERMLAEARGEVEKQ